MRENQDRRIRRTNRTLAAALIELTGERPYAEIQVRDITDRADIGYATFYRHYDNKDELMLAVFDDVMEELEMETVHPEEDYFTSEGKSIFLHMQKYHGLYQSILQNPEFLKKLKLLLTTRVEEHTHDHYSSSTAPAYYSELAAHQMVTTLIGLMEWWLSRDMDCSIEEMSFLYHRLVIQATAFAFQIEDTSHL